MNPSLLSLLRVSYPIIQAPMLGVSTPAMVAAIANAGGLGSLPLGGLAPDTAQALIRQVRAGTGRPFAVNLFAHPIDQRPDATQFRRMEDFLASVHAAYGLAYARRAPEDFRFYNHTDLMPLLWQEEVPIISFTFGMLEPQLVAQCKARGVVLAGTATSLREALLLEEAGVDAIVVQGVEAGGHRGSFLHDEPLPQTGLVALLPQLADRVGVPLIAAGGIGDARAVRAAFALGASAVQMGTYFLAADESAASPAYREAVLAATQDTTQLTQAFTGRWARGIRNGFMARMEASGVAPLPYPYHNSMTAALREHGKTQHRAELVALWAGQAVATTRGGSTQALFAGLLQQLGLIETQGGGDASLS